MVGSRMRCPARRTPREAPGLCPAQDFALTEAAIAVRGHGLHRPRVKPRVGNLLFPGFGTGLLNFSLIPLMTTCSGNKDSPLCAPISPGGCSGCLGDTRCWSWRGGGSKPGICITLKHSGQPWGLPKGMQVTRDRSDGNGVSCGGTSSDPPVHLISFTGCVRDPSRWKLRGARPVRLSCPLPHQPPSAEG